MSHATEKVEVLLDERLVEAEPMPEGFDFFLRGGFAEHRLRRIAGDQVDQREDQRGDAEQHGDREQQPSREKPQHGSFFRGRAKHCKDARLP